MAARPVGGCHHRERIGGFIDNARRPRVSNIGPNELGVIGLGLLIFFGLLYLVIRLAIRSTRKG